jgi:hypothetical protein
LGCGAKHGGGWGSGGTVGERKEAREYGARMRCGGGGVERGDEVWRCGG